MTTKNENKLKKLLEIHKPGMVFHASWLNQNGISRDLQQYYLKSGWLESLGTGAFKRSTDTITWESALSSIQAQSNISVYVGALSALAKQGFSHYFRFSKDTIYLFSENKKNLPRWYLVHGWPNPIKFIRTSLIPPKIGLISFEEENYALTMSSPERAILECIYISPKYLDVVECYQILEGLSNLRPKLLQQLLEECSSIKLKRLFLYLAEKANHQWFNFLDVEKMDMGAGDRRIEKRGTYIPKYKIVVPNALASL